MPFVDTDQSCEGHLRGTYGPDGMVRIDPPELMFYVSGVVEPTNWKVRKFGHSLAGNYLKVMKRLAEKNPSVDFRLMKSYRGDDPRPHYDFMVGEVEHSCPEEEAKAKLEGYRQVIDELTLRTRRFVQRHF